MHDSKFMSAQEKEKVLKDWGKFLESGCQKEKFTKLLYHHLIQHCSFIAHYDIHGFYDCYFLRGDDTVRFLSQFDGSSGTTPKSVEYGMTYWVDGDYRDINVAMIEAATPLIPGLVQRAQILQKMEDVDTAKRLLHKHGITLKEV